MRTLIPRQVDRRGSGDDRRPYRRGPSPGGSAARPLGCAPAGRRPATPRTPPRRGCWPRLPAATAAARRRQPPGAAWTRAWPGRPGLRQRGPPRTARRLKLSTLIRDQSSAPPCRAHPTAGPAQPLEHPGVGPLAEAPPAGRHAAAAELAHRQQRPRGRGAGHEHDRGHAGPIRHGAGRATAGVGGWGWQQRLDALPQRVGQELVGQSGHGAGIIASPSPGHCLTRGSGTFSK
jgi:hypothetical protein